MEAASFEAQNAEWKTYFAGRQAAPGLPKGFIHGELELDHLDAYFAWAAWATTALRPGTDYSYTNNWPYDPQAGNVPTASAYFWSAMSLISLLGGLGLILTFFGKYDFLGWGASRNTHAHEGRLSTWRLTPSQRVLGLYFAVVALLFLAQAALGGVIAHYRVDPGTFYGFDMARLLPYNLARTWHLQLAIFWIATAWVAGGLFLAPIVGGGEPKGQRLGAIVLLCALVIVVFGSLFGEMAGIRNWLGHLWFWFGHQGSEYLDLGRFWQLLLAAGLAFWLFLMFRALRPAIRKGDQGDLPLLFFLAATAIPVFYLPALFYGPHTNFAIIDNWRFSIIHLWVEGFFELFATVLVAVMFYQMGLVTSSSATRVIYLDAILYLGGGIVGTGHHWYFTGQSTLNMGLASCSAPSRSSRSRSSPWTPGTSSVSRTRSAPIAAGRSCPGRSGPSGSSSPWACGISWERASSASSSTCPLSPTSRWAPRSRRTTAMPRCSASSACSPWACSCSACARSHSDAAWNRAEKHIRRGFWGLNIGLGLMVLLDLFPAGVLQLWDTMVNGYWHARRLEFLMGGTYHTLEWIRIVADLTFLFVGSLPIAWATLQLVLKRDMRRDEA